MGSRAFLVRYTNYLLNNSKQCKNLFSSSALCNKDIQTREDKSAEIVAKDAVQKDRADKGYITIECELDGAGIVSGTPEEHIKNRIVLISKPTKNAMQSGTDNTHGWQISFEARERWENPLMGWCSSGDPLQAMRIRYETKEEAIRHCEDMGWKYIVQKPNVVNPKNRTYGDNFSWNKRTRVSTK